MADTSVVILIQSLQSNGSQIFSDLGGSPNSPHTIDTIAGEIHHDDAQAKFGPTSIRFDGNTDYLKFSPHADFNLTDNFTLETHVYVTGIPSAGRFIAVGDVASHNGG